MSETKIPTFDLDATAHEDTQQKLMALFEADDVTFNSGVGEFLDDRLTELSSTPQKERISAIDGNHQGFVGPETEVYPAALLGIPYKLDDQEPYRMMVGDMREYYKRLRQRLEPPAAFFNAALNVSQNTVMNYFGNVSGGASAAQEREDLLADLMDESPDYRSITEFKGVAMCAERALIANNCMQVVGLNPVVELGSLKLEADRVEAHAYLFVATSSGALRIYDPQNPTLTFSEDGRLVAASPATYLAENFAKGTDGETMTVDHRTDTVTQDGTLVAQELTPYQYGLGYDRKPLVPR